MKVSVHHGFIKFTSSPATPLPTTYLDENCDQQAIIGVSPFDTIMDPRWGCFQILPTQYSVQVRGANAALRDATVDPLCLDLYPDEKFTYKIDGIGGWNARIHGWTIKDDGKKMIPHMEIIWRPFLDQPAFPVGSGYTSPPYPEGMDDDSSSTFLIIGRVLPITLRLIIVEYEIPRRFPAKCIWKS
jgi:hypothetical protein